MNVINCLVLRGEHSPTEDTLLGLAHANDQISLDIKNSFDTFLFRSSAWNKKESSFNLKNLWSSYDKNNNTENEYL